MMLPPFLPVVVPLMVTLALGSCALSTPRGPQAANPPETEPARVDSSPTDPAPPEAIAVVNTVTPVTVVEGLEHPWGIAWLPNGDMLITERPGRLRRVSRDGTLDPTPMAGLPPVLALGQGGLLDIALHPQFEQNRQWQHRHRNTYSHWPAGARRPPGARRIPLCADRRQQRASDPLGASLLTPKQPANNQP